MKELQSGSHLEWRMSKYEQQLEKKQSLFSKLIHMVERNKLQYSCHINTNILNTLSKYKTEREKFLSKEKA